MRKLPPRFSKKRNTYFHVGYVQEMLKQEDDSLKKTVKRPYTSLGNDLNKAILKWAEIEAEQNLTANTFAALAAKYRKDVITTKKENTRNLQLPMLKLLVKVFGEMQLSHIKPHHIAEYLDTRTAKVSANREVQLLSHIFTKAIRWGMLVTNPTNGVERNAEKVRDRYVTDEEFQLIRESANVELRCMVDIGYATALRISDIRNIRRERPDAEIKEARKTGSQQAFSYIEMDTLYVEQIKTGAKQVFAVKGFLLESITTALNIERKVTSKFLFCTRNGTPHTKSGFDSKWQRFRSKLGLYDVHFHDIRAKAATDAKIMGINHQALLGHSDISQSEKCVKRRIVEEVETLDFYAKQKFKKK